MQSILYQRAKLSDTKEVKTMKLYFNGYRWLITSKWFNRYISAKTANILKLVLDIED